MADLWQKKLQEQRTRFQSVLLEGLLAKLIDQVYANGYTLHGQILYALEGEFEKLPHFVGVLKNEVDVGIFLGDYVSEEPVNEVLTVDINLVDEALKRGRVPLELDLLLELRKLLAILQGFVQDVVY